MPSRIWVWHMWATVCMSCCADVLKPHLTEEEYAFFRRGKNAHTHAAPKSATRAEYAKATGLEALFGALYLLGRVERLNELFYLIMEETDGI